TCDKAGAGGGSSYRAGSGAGGGGCGGESLSPAGVGWFVLGCGGGCSGGRAMISFSGWEWRRGGLGVHAGGASCHRAAEGGGLGTSPGGAAGSGDAARSLR